MDSLALVLQLFQTPPVTLRTCGVASLRQEEKIAGRAVLIAGQPGTGKTARSLAGVGQMAG